jgi:hypothetical protein
MSLVLAIGFLAVLSIVATTMLQYSASNARHANFQRSDDITIDLAEAGLARALSKLFQAPSATAPTLLSSETHTLPGGTTTVSGILAGETWNITSTSTVTNPNGSGEMHKTVTMQVQVGIDPSGNAAWNYVYSDAPATRPCMVLKNSVNIQAPLFVKGNLCLQNTAKASGSMVKVGGTVETASSGSIGDPGTNPITYVTDAKIAGGCRHGTSGSFSTADCNYTSPNRIWRTNYSTDPGVLEKPTIDLAYWYANSKPGPQQTCTTSTGTVPSFDNDGVMNRSLGNVDFMTSSAYTCTVTNGPHLQGKISWTPDDGDADSFGILEILGTVFFDGNLDLSANRQAIYTGRGTIYASGWIDFGTSRQICGAAACDMDAWDAEQNLLVMVSGNCNDLTSPAWPDCPEAEQNGAKGFEIGQSSIFQGAVYAVSDFNSTSTAQMQGPVIAHQLFFEQSGVANKWVAIEAMTMGTPGGGRKLNVLSTGF